jgi:hypothetical protein
MKVVFLADGLLSWWRPTLRFIQLESHVDSSLHLSQESPISDILRTLVRVKLFGPRRCESLD